MADDCWLEANDNYNWRPPPGIRTLGRPSSTRREEDMKLEVNARMLALVLMKFLQMIPRKTKSATAVILLKLAVSWDGILQVLAVNDNVRLKATLPVSVEVPGSLCVPPKALVDLVRSIAQPGRSIHVENEDLAQQLNLTSGNIKHVLTSSPGDNVQDSCDDEAPLTTIQIPVAVMSRALDQLSPVQTMDSKGGSVTETCLDVDELGHVRLVTTDTYRLAIVKVPGVQVSGDTQARSWVLRNMDLHLLAGVMKGKDSAKDEVVLSLGTKGWTASWGYYRLTAPFSEKRFPNWRSIVPRSYTNSLSVDGGELLDRLQMASRLGDRKSARLRFRWNGSSECALLAGNRELGAETTSSLGLRWNQREALPDTELVLDARLLEPLVKRLEDQVELAFTAPALPAMVRSVDPDRNVEYLVMPVNL
jgi:DNA polymerase-3 subunit beta